ncbi:serine/threonine protein kinase [Thalassoroseus pseudoceratinae]|uniref:serine/threonine protein kinase n=1 Tax=Thalassoroseus pseudoceratinae TaxID=2713176 RepID=UPI001F0DAFD5|nr:serine/threonine-protein kinase [Thalassoroseus pseudoceratinae]
MTNPEPNEDSPTELEHEAVEKQLFDALDAYVEALHSRDGDSLQAVQTDHPDAHEFFECLQHLEQLADDDSDGSRTDGDASASTILWNSHDSQEFQSSNEGCPADFPGSQQFGRYWLIHELGRGGMGVVHKAWQSDLERFVAIKMILHSHLASADQVRRFYAEARSAGRLRHANIVGIHEVGDVGGQPFFAMDYIEGQSLTQLIEDKPLPADEAARIVADVARAVQFLHDHELLHRDLKPSNILIDENGTPFVTDFGLAKMLTDSRDSGQTQSGTIIGTPSYMAPEQAAGRMSQISQKSDIYSLGAILYELLCGRPPFKQDNVLDTLVDVLEGEPTLICQVCRDVPEELQVICHRCLEKDSGARFESAGDLANELERYLRREPIQSKSSGLVSRVKRWGRREPALAARLVGVVLAMIVLQVNYWSADDIPVARHSWIMGVLGFWGVSAFVFQKMMHRDHLADLTRFLWSGTEVVLLTLILAATEGPYGPLLVAYPALVTCSGLFFRVRLVLFTLVCAVLGVIALLAFRTDAAPEHLHYTVIFLFATILQGCMVAFQVYRVRILSRHFDHRRLP